MRKTKIKFKCWDKHFKQFALMIDIEALKSARDHPDRYIALEFTGLKDKKGNDIYEGDIIKFWKTSISYICFEHGSFVSKDKKSKVGDGTGGSLWQNKEHTETECEVVGTIYTDSELIK